MSEHVWLSIAKQKTSLWQPVTTDISENDINAAIEGQKLNDTGLPVPRHLCPNKIWRLKDALKSKTMPDIFFASCQWFVSERAADVLRKFDLGSGALYPLTEGVFQKDRVTRLPGNYFCWTFGNTKSVFLPEVSQKVRAPEVPGLWWKMPWNPVDGDIAVSRDALTGPDVWVDKILFQSIFLSGPLGDALDEIGLLETFRLFKCRVV